MGKIKQSINSFWKFLAQKENHRAILSITAIFTIAGIIFGAFKIHEVSVDLNKIKAAKVETEEIELSQVCFSESKSETLGISIYDCRNKENILLEITQNGATTTLGF